MPAKPQLADSQDPGAQNRIRAKRMVMETYVSRFDPRELPQQYPPSHEWKDRAYNDLSRVVDEVGGQFPQETDRNAVLENAANEAVALGPLEYFLDDDSVTSIYVHGPNQIVVEKEGRLQVAAEAWSNADFLYLTAQRLLSMQGFTPQNSPAFNEVRFSDGTLVQVVLPPVAVGAPVITVRKPRRKFPNLSDLVGQGTLSNNMAEFLHQCVEARRTILVAGPASSGRTTLVNALLGLVPDGARIVAVEQTSMLQLPQRTAVTLEAQPATSYAPGLSAEELAESAVRMRADRVVVEDISAGEAHGLLLAAAAGAAGSVGVISALSAQDAVSGLVQLAQTSRHKPDYTGLVAQVARSVDVVLVCNRFGDGSRRVVEIAEIVGTTDNRYELDTIFTWSGGGMGPGGGGNGRFSASGTVPRFYQELENGGVRLDTNIFRD